ncbi:MAG: LamG domain-containing protein, partial [Methanoculleaceae archaeon]
QGAADHLLYHIELSARDADAMLTDLTLTMDGTYNTSDIRRFRLYYSEDGKLDPGTDTGADPILAEHDVVSPGESLVFTDLARMIRKGNCHIFLTADIEKYAVARELSVTETLLENLTFADDVAYEPADTVSLAAGGVQTFPTPKVTVDSPTVPSVTVAQDIPNHPLYRISLDVSDARVLLTRAAFTTDGTYNLIDIDRFRLIYSEDGTLDDGDTDIGTHEVILPGEIAFENLSLTIEKGTSAHLFLTADIGAANGARTVSITETALDRLSFQEPENMILSGTDPMTAGAEQTFPVPKIVLTAPKVPDAEIEQEIPNLVLFRMNIEVTRADAVLMAMPLITGGTYMASDLVSGFPFKLRYSEDETLDPDDPVLGKVPFDAPGKSLIFSGLSQTIAKGTTGYVFLTVDIGRANGARTLYIQGPWFEHFTFEFGDKEGKDPMAAGGVQTFPVPAITITAPEVEAAEVPQETPDHILYRLNLGIARAEAVLESLTLKTRGTYLTSDLVPGMPFKLRYSTNDSLSAGDATIGTSEFVETGKDLTFTDLSQFIDKGKTAYLFVTADIGEAVGRHISILKMPFRNITFEFGDKFGDNPSLPGGTQQFPVPHIQITSPAVESFPKVMPRTTDLLLYRVNMDVTEAAAILESLTLVPTGTYRNSDIRTGCSEMETCNPVVERELPVFKLWYSDDDVLGEGDPVISESLFVLSDSNLEFTDLKKTILKGTSGYLFITANVGPSVGKRTIWISETPFEKIGFGYREKTDADPPVAKIGQSPLAQGSQQTFAEILGNLLELDGAEDSMDIPYDKELNSSKFTVSVRASIARQEDDDGNTVMTRQSIVSSINENANRGYEIFVDTDNRVKFRIGTGSGWKVIDGPEIVTHEFYDVTGTYNGSGASLFVNGDSFGENERTGFRPNTSDPLLIGSQPGEDAEGEDAEEDPDVFFDGQITDLHIWNIPRTQPDIEASIEVPPTDDEAGIVAHYRFTLWGTLADTTGRSHDGEVLGNPAWTSVLTGLWIGQIEISEVNEVGFGSADTDTPRDVTHPFDMRILLHVDAADNVRLLRHVTLMQKRYELENEDGTTEEMARRVLVTDDNRLHEYEGVVRRDGKLVGIRLGSLFFDFDPSLNALPVDGIIRQGASLSGKLTLAADHPHNPFRHLYHPDLRSGRKIERHFTMDIPVDEKSELEDPKEGVSELDGVYEEVISGLHKIPLKIKGTFHLERISTIQFLNDDE